MLAPPAAAINIVDPIVWDCISPMPAAATSTAAVAGSKIKTLKRCANTAPTSKLAIASKINCALPRVRGG
jgi:hypothetical protein